MMILENGRDTPVVVYGIYWKGSNRYYWVIPYEGYGGFLSVNEKDARLIDSSFASTYLLCKDGDGADMILHWAAEDLLENLVDCEPSAMEEFQRRLAR